MPPPPPRHRSACSPLPRRPILPAREIQAVRFAPHPHLLTLLAHPHSPADTTEKPRGEIVKKRSEARRGSSSDLILPTSTRFIYPPSRKIIHSAPHLGKEGSFARLRRRALRRRRHGHRGSRQAVPDPALPRDDPRGDRGPRRQERVEQVGHLQVHRGQVRRAPPRSRVAADRAPGAHEGVRRAHLPQKQLLPRRRPRRAAEARARAPAQGAGPERAGAAAQVAGAVRGDGARPRAPAQGQEPAGGRREAGHRGDAQGPRPPAQEGQDHRGRRVPGSQTGTRTNSRPRRRRLHPRQARPRQASQGTPRRAQRDGRGLTPPLLLVRASRREDWLVG